MAAFSKIDRTFWSDDFIGDLTPEEKYFYLYLLSNMYVNAAGCYKLRMRTACFELGYNKDTIEKLITRFIDLKRILFDKNTNEVLILNWNKYNWSKRTTTINAIKKDLKAIESPDLKEKIEKLFDAFLNSENGLQEVKEGQEGSTEVETEKKRIEEEQEEEKEKEIYKEKFKKHFEEFWNAYPNKKAKANARKAWDKLKPSKAMFENIMKGLNNAISSKEWTKDNGEFIPHPATWLNGGRWQDVYTPLACDAQKTVNHPPNTALQDRLKYLGDD